jgi:hypothetical protein
MFSKLTIIVLLIAIGIVKANEDPILNPNPNKPRMIPTRPSSPTNNK